MKRLIALILIGTMAASLMACSIGEPSSTDECRPVSCYEECDE